MAIGLEFDTSGVSKGLDKFSGKALDAAQKALSVITEEVLRLSEMEVPHDTGSLQNSGTVEKDGKDLLVGYNRPYAARLHEHPEYRFQKGRKGKYLEDPIKKNVSILKRFYADSLRGILNG